MSGDTSDMRRGELVWGGLAVLMMALAIGTPIAMTGWLSLRDPGSSALGGQAWAVVVTSGEAGYALALSLVMGGLVAIAATLCGLPLSYLIGIRAGALGRWLLALVLILWLLDPGIRILGWMQVIKSGVSHNLLPDAAQGNAIAELVARIHGWLPMTIVLQSLVFSTVPKPLLAAARECGAGPWYIFRRIVWPDSRSRILLVTGLVFCGATGGFLEPRLLGSGQFEQATEWLQRAMESEIGWPYAGTMLLLLLTLSLLPAILLLKSMRR